MSATRSSRARLCVLAILGAAAFAAAAEPQAEPAPPFEYPARFTANYMAVNNPGPTRAGRVTLTLERASTKDERIALLRTLKEKGQDALIAAMEGSEVGRIQIDTNLSWPIAVASVFRTDKGWIVRAATNRRMTFGEVSRNDRSSDYPVGILELLITPDGKGGEGVLVGATRVRFDENGRLEIESLPQNTGPQKLTNVTVAPAKKKKTKGEN